MVASSGEPLEPLPLAPALRALEEEFEFLREVGRGGMAAVYLARARASGRVVAIKTVAAHRAHDPEAVARFEREARTVLSLDHPNIVRSYSVEQLEGGALAIVMQHAAGGTLREALREAQRAGVPFSPERVAQVVADVAAALAHAHERGVVHRDVKPENIFLDPRNGRTLLSDFGIARHLEGDNALTMTGLAIGTPTYMAPEQIDGGGVDGRSDVYALGLVGWEMLAGARPWDGDSLYSVIYKQRHEALAPLEELRPDAPPALRAAIERALEKDPADRWPDADAFAAAVRAAIGSDPAAAAAGDAGAAPRTAEHEGRAAEAAAPAGVADWSPSVVTGTAAGAAAPDASPERDRGSVVSAPDDGGDRDDVWGDARARALVPAEVPTAPLRTRYGSARPAARLAVPLALALVAAFAVREGARAHHTHARASSDSAAGSDTLRAGGDVVAADGATRTDDALAAAGSSGTTAANGASTSVAAPATVNLARFALTHGDSLALCRSPAARDQRACFTAVLADRDARLNAVYSQLVRELRDRDAGAADRLRSEEIRWLAVRDADCAHVGRGREGPLWGRPRASCLGDAADLRADTLAAQLARLRGR